MLQFCLIGPAEDCDMNPAGNSNPSIIPDGLMTASSYYSDDYKPYYGRFNGSRGDGWCSQIRNSSDDWLQIDLRRTVQVCAVATRGDVSVNEWTTDFKLSFSTDTKTWITYKNDKGTEEVRFDLSREKMLSLL